MFDFSKRPWPLVFVAESVTDRRRFAQGSHCSGEFVFSFTGLMQVATIAEQYISPPPGHGIWLPPHVVHSAMNLYETCFCSVFIDEKWCSSMPSQVSILGVNSLLRAILEHLCRHSLTVPSSRAEESLFQVLYDQLCESPVGENYLTLSDDPELSLVLSILQENPGDNRSNAQLAKAVGTTERTLLRKSSRELGMSLTEWRRRLRVMRATALLRNGHTVEATALDLGYSSASSFIAMFRRMTGTTPASLASEFVSDRS